jgi:hypothetical protein
MKTRASKRISARIANHNIRRTVKCERGHRRLVINVNNSIKWINTRSETCEQFIDKKFALLINTLALSDGTFVRLYALPDHASDVEPWYILNERASHWNIDTGTSISEIIDGDSSVQFGKLVHGPVMLTRVDEDGQELGLNRDSYNDLCELYE